MNLHFFSIAGDKRQPEIEKHPLTPAEEQLLNISEGGEFLDDTLRMKEQPLMYIVEESVAAGNPKNFL